MDNAALNIPPDKLAIFLVGSAAQGRRHQEITDIDFIAVHDGNVPREIQFNSSLNGREISVALYSRKVLKDAIKSHESLLVWHREFRKLLSGRCLHDSFGFTQDLKLIRSSKLPADVLCRFLPDTKISESPTCLVSRIKLAIGSLRVAHGWFYSSFDLRFSKPKYMTEDIEAIPCVDLKALLWQLAKEFSENWKPRFLFPFLLDLDGAPRGRPNNLHLRDGLTLWKKGNHDKAVWALLIGGFQVIRMTLAQFDADYENAPDLTPAVSDLRIDPYIKRTLTHLVLGNKAVSNKHYDLLTKAAQRFAGHIEFPEKIPAEPSRKHRSRRR